MPLDRSEAIRRLRAVVVATDPKLELDAAAVHYRDQTVPQGYFPGYDYGLRWGQGHAMLFLPAEDLEAPDWQQRAGERLRLAARYVEALARRGQV